MAITKKRKEGREPAGRLATQIPEGGFPSGVGVPSACLLVLLLALAGLTVVVLTGRSGPAVPREFTQGQEKFATSTARSVGASANQSLSDLRTATAGRPTGDVDALLDTVARNRKWRGAAVLSGPGRTVDGARGEQVPTQAVPASVAEAAVTSVVAPNGELHLLSILALPNDRLLVATSAVTLPAPPADALRQSLYLTTGSGQVVATSNVTGLPEGPQLVSLIGDAGRAAGADKQGSRLGPRTGDVQAVVAHAKVAPAGQRDPIDLAVVVVAYGPLTDSTGASSVRTWGPAGLLAIVAVLGFLLVRWSVVGPVRRLRRDILTVAAGNLRTPVRGTGAREVVAIAESAEVCRADLRETDPGPRRRGRAAPAIVAVIVASVAVLGWSAGVLVVLAGNDAPVPDALVTSIRNQTDRATDALRRSMNDGLADLQRITASGDSDALRPAMDELVATQARYRSVYVVDRDGRSGPHVGREPLRVTELPPARAGVRQQNNAGRVPVIFAHVPLTGTDQTVVGEFDLDHLAGMLDQAPGAVRLVDAEFRTISATGGYVAFEVVTGDGVRRSANLAQRGEPVAELQEGPEGPTIVASAAVFGGEIGRLGWTVVADNPVADLALPVNDQRRNAMLIGLIGALLAALLFGWHLVVVIRPLRRVVQVAGALADGDRDSVIYPQRPDEIGTIASCLEICRQALTQGQSRLGTVRRPAGSATDSTVLITKITDADPTPVRAGNRHKPRSSHRVRTERDRVGQQA